MTPEVYVENCIKSAKKVPRVFMYYLITTRCRTRLQRKKASIAKKRMNAALSLPKPKKL